MKKPKVKDMEMDMKKVDEFNDFMIKKGAFVRIGDQLVQNPAYPYSYQLLFDEFNKLTKR